jgi:hypothetical protein
MFSLDDRPAPPEAPAFSAEMEQFLVSAARSHAAAHKPKRRALIAVAGCAAAVAVAVGAAVAVNGAHGAPQRITTSQVHVHLADFSVDTNPSGTVTVTLNRAQILDPAALGQALSRAGVPAKITIGSACYNPQPDRGPQPVGLLQPGPAGTSVIVITPSKMPAGSTLAIGYLHNSNTDGVNFSLLTAGAPVTCSANLPQGNEKPVHVPSDSSQAE